MMERTCIIIKPDGVKRNLVDEIIKRYEDAGLNIVAKKELTADDKLLSEHYSAHVGKPFYEPLKEFIYGNTHSLVDNHRKP